MKILNRRELAIKLANDKKINLNNVSKKLNKIIALWISRNEIIQDGKYIICNF
jgi:hypothetical protein